MEKPELTFWSTHYFTFKSAIHYNLICLTFKVKEFEYMVGIYVTQAVGIQ